jgi:hypothetical protein
MTPYQSDLELLTYLRLQVKRALQKMAFDIRQGTADQQALFNAVFSNQTRFSLNEATLLALHCSEGLMVDLTVLRELATDEQVQITVANIQALLIGIQKDTNRSLTNLDL